MISTYVSDTSFTDLEKEIELKSSQGLSLVDIDYADLGDGKGEWIAEFESLSENTVLVFNENYDIFLEDMRQKVQEGYELIDLEINNGYNSAVLIDSPENKLFSATTNLDTFTGQIQQRWDQHYDLVNVEYGDGIWFGVFEKTSQLSGYSYSTNLDDFHETRKNYAENGYYLTDLELDNNQGIFGVYQTAYTTNSSSITDLSSLTTIGQNYIEQSTEGLYELGSDITSSNITTNNLLFASTFI